MRFVFAIMAMWYMGKRFLFSPRKTIRELKDGIIDRNEFILYMLLAISIPVLFVAFTMYNLGILFCLEGSVYVDIMVALCIIGLITIVLSGVWVIIIAIEMKHESNNRPA